MSLVPFMQTFKSDVGYVHVAKHEYDCNQSSGLIILKRGQILVHYIEKEKLEMTNDVEILSRIFNGSGTYPIERKVIRRNGQSQQLI